MSTSSLSGILTSNFLNLLRSGAFDESKPISIMSEYKWSQVVLLAHYHGVTPFLAKGIEHYHFDDNLNIPKEQIEQVKEHLKTSPSQGLSDLYVASRLHLHNKEMNKQLQHLVSQEYSDPERSYETLQLLAILICNVESILAGRSSLRGLIDLGRYLRQEGDKVDFVKLERWLGQTRMMKMACLQGTLLAEGFGFTKEELPFVSKFQPNSRRWLLRALMLGHFANHPTSTGTNMHDGFALSSPGTAWRTIRHALAYRRLAPGETISTICHGIMRGLAEIDE